MTTNLELQMNKSSKTKRLPQLEIEKVATGVTGLDEILNGGLPKGRPTLVCGGAGCGKTLLAMEFLCRGAVEHGEPGIFIAFEETAEELAANVASLGFDLATLERDGLLIVDYVAVGRGEVLQTGAFDLEGLFIRIASSVAAIGAQRIVIDTIEVLFGALKDAATIRWELDRLFVWLKEQGLTAIITSERGDESGISRNGIEEYVADCVILLDHRITDERSTRRLRVLKYRGALHGSNEYPFLISSSGFVVFPVTSLGLQQTASTTRISTGIGRLDARLSGGVYKGSSVLISGSAGSGKTILASHFADAACRRGEKTLYVSYEESAAQIERNMESVGLDLGRWRELDLLRIESIRPTLLGLESHLWWLTQLLEEFDPSTIVIDPITSFLRVGSKSQTSSMLLRQVDILKSKGVTALFTALVPSETNEHTDVEVSSLIDTWIAASMVESGGERNRTLSVVKSRGMSHSNQLTEFVITNTGVDLLDTYVGAAGVLTGSARIVQQAIDRVRHAQEVEGLEDRRRQFDRRTGSIEDQVIALLAEYRADDVDLSRVRAAVAQLVGSNESTHYSMANGSPSAPPTPSDDREGPPR
jgi:circadian clock protein KaiC